MTVPEKVRNGAGQAQLDDQAVVETLAGPLRRIVGSRVPDPHLADDVVQETLLRVLGASDRVDADALLPYAVVTARNLVTSRARRDATAERHAPGLVEVEASDGPEEAVLRFEEADAVRAALDALPERDRETLVAHEVHGLGTDELARSGSSTPGGVAAQLARTRARMRVEYVLAFRRVRLPTASCKPVLLALSMGDQRRQRALDAGSHLLTCPTCAELSDPLLTRKRGLAGVVPVAFAWLVGKGAPGTGVQATAQAVGAAAVVAAVGTVVVLSGSESGSAPDAPAARLALVVGTGRPAVTPAALREADRADRTVTARDAVVLRVSADEGYWVANGEGRLWVRLVGRGESSMQVRAGQRLDFEGQAEWRASGVEVRVPIAAVTTADMS